MTFFKHHQGKRGFHVLTETSSWSMLFFTCGYSPADVSDVVQEAMHKFLESRGVLVGKDYYPNGPADQQVRAFKGHSLLGPDLNSPCICLNQTFKGK